MAKLLEELKRSIESLEEVDWDRITSLQAIDILELGDQFKDEMVGLMADNDGSKQFGNTMRSIEFNEDGSVKKVEFYGSGTSNTA